MTTKQLTFPFDLVFQVDAKDEWSDGPLYAVVEITRALAELIVSKAELVKREDLSEVRTYDPVIWLENAFEIPPGKTYVFVEPLYKEDFDAGEGSIEDKESTSMMGEELVITESRVWWTCYEKHSDCEFETRGIQVDFFRDLLKANPA